MTTPTVRPLPGAPKLVLGSFDVPAIGYTVREYVVSGSAAAYATNLAGSADFATRVVVLAPADPQRFSGTVLVEWLNVSGGIDAPAVWLMAHREMVRAGHAYVAVSAQSVGVEGGPSMTGFDMSLKSQEPERYSALHHPGDAYAFDMFSQVGQVIRDRPHELLNELAPHAVIAIGESQSAMFLTTYVNHVDPIVAVYDAFLVHSRFGPAAPLDGTSIFESPAGADVVPFRADLRVPVLTVLTETDILGGLRTGYADARRPDSDVLRAWEISGSAHADNYTIKVGFIDSGLVPPAELAAAWAPTTNLMGHDLAYAINFGPQHHYVLQAALACLVEWVRSGVAPPTAPVLETSGGNVCTDELGIALGGVRTPWVDVPVGRTSGVGRTEPVMAMLFGSGEMFAADVLDRLYPGGAAEYLDEFPSALDRAIGAGFVLQADRQEILELAALTCPSWG